MNGIHADSWQRVHFSIEVLQSQFHQLQLIGAGAYLLRLNP